MLLFVLAHLIGDFVLQTNKVAYLKASGKWKDILPHIIIISFIQILALSIFGLKGLLAAVICSLIHYFIDYLKIYINKLFYDFQFLSFIADQLIHFLVIIILTILLAPDFEIFDKQQYFKIRFFISTIIVTYLSSVAVKTLIRDLNRDIRSEIFFKKFERLTDALLGCILFAIGFLPLIYIIPISISVLLLYKTIEKNQFDYIFNFVFYKYVLTFFISYSAYVFTIS